MPDIHKLYIATGSFYFGHKQLPSDIALEATGTGTLEDPYVVTQGASIYSTDGTLTSNRTVNLGGMVLYFEQGGDNLLVISPPQSVLQAYNTTGDGNAGRFKAQANSIRGSTEFSAYFNGGDKEATIIGFADVATSTLTHIADRHIFTGKVNESTIQEFADNAAAVAGGLLIGDHYRTGDTLKICH